MNEQTEQITRVSEAIAAHVMAFISSHLNQEFHAADLRQFVAEQMSGYIAPGSPDRILRDLRQKQKVNYEVVSRSKSLYKALPVTGQLALFQ